jgi:GNAT superfamily N-acetyltransferase
VSVDTPTAEPLPDLRQAVQVAPVRGRRDLRAFVDLPFRLHAGTPWVPPLKLERYAYLSPRFNPFFKHGEAELFLARRDGRVVGRISAQIDHHFNEFHGNRWGLFGFLEFEDDQEILDALLSAAGSWLRERGRDRMVGPMDFVTNEECGVLIEGHELEPMIRQPWQPVYYQQRCEAAGLEKAMDLFHWDVLVTDRDERMLPILPQLAERCATKYGIRIRKMSFLRLRRDLDEFAKVYNAAWSRNWGFVPYDEHDLDDLAITYRLVFDKHWFMIAENDQETVAVAITIPDINQALKRMKGRLLPFGWWYYLNRRRYIDRCRVGFLGVLPEYQHTGVAAQLYIEHFDMAAATRIDFGEAGWILETNSSMNRGLEAMGGRIVKRCRVYERRFDPSAEPALPPELRPGASA